MGKNSKVAISNAKVKATGKSKFHHNHSYNPKAHESDERKMRLLNQLEIKRHEKNIDRLLTLMRSYAPESLDSDIPMNEMYELKGAAKVAQEYYRPLGWKPPIDPINVLIEFKDNLWEHEIGMEYLCALCELGIAYHNIGNKTRDAITTFQKVLSYDIDDHAKAGQHLLRCYMSNALGDKARELINKYPQNKSCCFRFSLVLLEHISLNLEEKESSLEIVKDTLAKAFECNSYFIWLIMYHDIFKNVIEQVERINTAEVVDGSIEDAIVAYQADVELWYETEGAVDLLHEYTNQYKLKPPSSENDNKESVISEDTTMFLGMFSTGIEMIEELIESQRHSQSNTNKKR